MKKYYLLAAMLIILGVFSLGGCVSQERSGSGKGDPTAASIAREGGPAAAGQTADDETATAGQTADDETATAGQTADDKTASVSQTENDGTDSWEESSSQLNEIKEAEPLEIGIQMVNKQGNVILNISADTMKSMGYEPADIIHVRIGRAEINMPVGTAYSDVDHGQPICCYKYTSDKEDGWVILSVNYNSFLETMGMGKIEAAEDEEDFICVWNDGFDQSMAVEISMAEKQGYVQEYEMHRLASTRSYKREDYPQLSDEEYANFRVISTNGMGRNVLFRSSSPVNPALNRNKEADKALLDARIRTVLNLEDTEKIMVAYPDYNYTSYSECNILALNMGMTFGAESFKAKFAKGLRYMIDHEGPVLIHCKEGKDRTGYTIAILECLMGAGPDEVVKDYMLTYYNFYGVEEGTRAYEIIAGNNIETSLAKSFAIESIHDENVDLAQCARNYLKSIGMTENELEALRKMLSKDYSLE